MKQKACIALIALFALGILGGCGIINNLNATRKGLAAAFLPHPYKFEEAERQSILESGQSIVSLNFQSNVLTEWKKINDDGSISDDSFRLTYATSGSAGRRESKLEPGTYFLNGTSFTKGSYSYRSGSLRDTLSNEASGWDADKNTARCFSFTLVPGEELFVPDVTVSTESKIKESMCPRLSIDGEPSPHYQIGPESD